MNDFLRLLNGSKEYSMEGSILTIRNYRTGETIKLDLSVLQHYENVLEDIIVEEDK